MDLAYRGAGYHGWQVQPDALTVQEVLEKCLSTLLRERTPIVGAGRTDAGVNARRMTAHFDGPDALNCQGAVRRLNAMAGPDIAVHSIYPVAPDAHARFDAVARTYHYYVHHVKSPFVGELSWYCPRPLDYEAMNRAAAVLLETEDFTSFAKLHTDTLTNICHVTEARWEPAGEGRHVFVITANRFLRNMVRAVVGTLVDVGRGKMTVEQFREVIARRDRCAASTSMPAHALYLWAVTYPASITLDNPR